MLAAHTDHPAFELLSAHGREGIARVLGVVKSITDPVTVAQGAAGAAPWPVTIPSTSSLFSPDQVSAFGELVTVQPKAITGWTFAYNELHPELHRATTTGAGGLSFSNGKAVLTTGAAINSSSIIQTRRGLHYIPGVGGKAPFTVFFPADGAVGSKRTIGVGDASDGFFVGYRDDGGVNKFGVIRRSAGVETFTPQANFNVDVLDGVGASAFLYDPTKGNVFQILYQWLGFGPAMFFVESPTTRRLILCHYIQYANANTETSVRNPQLPLWAEVENVANATAVTLQTPSGMLFQHGDPGTAMTVPWTASGVQAGIGPPETRIFHLQSVTPVNGVTSRIINDLIDLWVSTTGGGAAGTLTVYRVTATQGAAPVWTAVPRSISMQIDTTATFQPAGATLLVQMRLQNNTSANRALSDMQIDVLPGEMLCVTGQTTGAAQNWEVSLAGREAV